MNIDDIEDNIGKLPDDNYRNITELIIDSLRTFPSDEYSDELEVVLNNILIELQVEDITIGSMKNYLSSHELLLNEKQIWINDSIGSLLKAFEFIEFYKLSFQNVIEEMKKIS